MVWFGLVWFGLVWFGLVWFGLVWFGLVWFSVIIESLCHGEQHSSVVISSLRFVKNVHTSTLTT